MLIRVILIKHATEDGLIEFWEDVPLGKVYYADLNTKRKQRFFNAQFNKYHTKEIVDVQDENGKMLWLPLEVLEIIK